MLCDAVNQCLDVRREAATCQLAEHRVALCEDFKGPRGAFIALDHDAWESLLQSVSQGDEGLQVCRIILHGHFLRVACVPSARE